MRSYLLAKHQKCNNSQDKARAQEADATKANAEGTEREPQRGGRCAGALVVDFHDFALFKRVVTEEYKQSDF
jgi:hypothetical protein